MMPLILAFRLAGSSTSRPSIFDISSLTKSTVGRMSIEKSV